MITEHEDSISLLFLFTDNRLTDDSFTEGNNRCKTKYVCDSSYSRIVKLYQRLVVANVAQKITTLVKIKVRIVSTQTCFTRYEDSEFLARTILTGRNPITKPIGYIHFSTANPGINSTRAPANAAPIKALMTLRFTFEERSTARPIKKPKKHPKKKRPITVIVI